MNDPFSIDLEDPHLASLLEAERMNHGVWRRASSEPLEFDSAETGKRTEAPPLTRYFVRQLERLGAGIIDASEGERPSWRFIIRIQASFEIAGKILAAKGFEVILRSTDPPAWDLELWGAAHSQSARDRGLSVYAEMWEKKLGSLGITDLRFTQPVGSA